GKFRDPRKCDDYRAFRFAVYMQRRNIFHRVAAFFQKEFALVLLPISNLRRQQFKPFFKSAASENARFDLAGFTVSAGYDADIFQLGNECARFGTEPFAQEHRYTSRNLFRVDGEEKTSAKIGNE